ncbi:MAG: hypothetical protein WBA57_12895 [Elainellaceae cyanobacterium]
MKSAAIDIESLGEINPEDLSFYLERHGWRKDNESKRDGASIWTLRLGDERLARVLVPLDNNEPDFSLTIYDLIRILSTVENRSEAEVFLSVKGSSATAKNINKQVINLRLSHEDGNPNTLEIRKLGPLLVNLQALINAIAQYEDGIPTEVGPISKDITNKTQFSVVTTFKGSFGITLANEAESALIQRTIFDEVEEPLIHKTIRNFMSLLEVSTEEEQLREHLVRIRKRAASGYRNFLLALAIAETNNVIEWGSPNGEASKRVELSFIDVMNAVNIVSKITIEEPRNTEIELAEWIGGNARRRDFEIQDISTGETYRGEVSPQAIRDAERARWHDVYRALIQEDLVVDTSTQNVKKRFTLMSLDSLETQEPED